MPPPYDYASTQVNIPADSTAALAMAAMRSKISVDHLGENGLEDEPHITARYGLIDGADKVRDYLKAQKPFPCHDEDNEDIRAR